jgi:TRAP-type C4-dicarboxylate transport system permease small subunit
MFSLVLRVLNNIMAFLGAVMVLFMMLAISYSVISRFVWNKPVPWVVEVSSYLMLYITFLGVAWLQRKEGHVRIDLFTSRLSPSARAALDALTSLGGAAVGLILAWKGFFITLDYYSRGVTVIGILNTPQYLLMAVIPLGSALLALEFIMRFFRFFANPASAGSEGKPSEKK